MFFDLDDTLLWDEKSIQEAFDLTCEAASKQFGVDAKALEDAVRKEARALYASYETYPFTQMIGINPFEGLWGTFDDPGEQFQQMKKIVPTYQKEAWTKGLAQLGIEDEAAGELLARTFIDNRIASPFLYEETFDVLDALKGRYQLVLMTNGAPSLQRKKLEITPELLPYFDHILISGEVGVGKPDVHIFKEALGLCDVQAEEAIMVGDNRMTDILGANRVGIPSVWINHHGAERSEVEPTYEIKRLNGLLEILEKSVELNR